MTTESLECRINVRVTTKEHAEIRAAAEEANLALSEYVRRRVLGRRIVVSDPDLHLRAELARIGDIVVKLSTRGGDPSEIQRALDAIVAASQRLRASGADHHDR